VRQIKNVACKLGRRVRQTVSASIKGGQPASEKRARRKGSSGPFGGKKNFEHLFGRESTKNRRSKYKTTAVHEKMSCPAGMDRESVFQEDMRENRPSPVVRKEKVSSSIRRFAQRRMKAV